MAQQTAVEWLHIEFQKRFPKETYEMYNNNQLSYEQMIEQANKMFEQQIIKTYKEGHYHLEFDTYNPEQYYNETYKNK